MQSTGAAEAIAEVAAERLAPPRQSARLASVRVSPEGYLATACALTFVSFLCLRSSQDIYALAFITLAWMVIPLCAFTDRLNFDGRLLSRQGLVSLIHRVAVGRRFKLPLDEIERIETSAVRTLRRGGRV